MNQVSVTCNIISKHTLVTYTFVICFLVLISYSPDSDDSHNLQQAFNVLLLITYLLGTCVVGKIAFGRYVSRATIKKQASHEERLKHTISQ